TPRFRYPENRRFAILPSHLKMPAEPSTSVSILYKIGESRGTTAILSLTPRGSGGQDTCRSVASVNAAPLRLEVKERSINLFDPPESLRRYMPSQRFPPRRA